MLIIDLKQQLSEKDNQFGFTMILWGQNKPEKIGKKWKKWKIKHTIPKQITIIMQDFNMQICILVDHLKKPWNYILLKQ